MWSFVCIRTSGLSNRDSNRESNRQWGIDCLIGLDGYSFLTIGLRRSNSPGDDGLIIGSNSVQGSTDRFCWIQVRDFQILLFHVQLVVSTWPRSGPDRPGRFWISQNFRSRSIDFSPWIPGSVDGPGFNDRALETPWLYWIFFIWPYWFESSWSRFSDRWDERKRHIMNPTKTFQW